MNAGRYLGRAWVNFRGFGGPKSWNANEAHFRTPVDVTGCAAESRPRADSKGPVSIATRPSQGRAWSLVVAPKRANGSKIDRSRTHFCVPKMGTKKGPNFGTALYAVKRVVPKLGPISVPISGTRFRSVSRFLAQPVSGKPKTFVPATCAPGLFRCSSNAESVNIQRASNIGIDCAFRAWGCEGTSDFCAWIWDLLRAMRVCACLLVWGHLRPYPVLRSALFRGQRSLRYFDGSYSCDSCREVGPGRRAR